LLENLTNDVAVKDSKTALVLAGGGLTGAVYEIGALRAIDELLIGLTVNDFDIYVGTSAGALVGAFLANGISPEQMMQSLDGSLKDVAPLQRKHIFNIKRSELLRVGTRFPHIAIKAWLEYLKNLGDMTIFDVMWQMLEAFPAGFYDGLALDKYIRHVIDRSGKSNFFVNLDKELHIVVTDLDTGDRKIFNYDTPGVLISQAVAASSAVPIMYKPVRIEGSDYVDGGMRGNASLDVAIEQGANLVICINPMVPFDNSNHQLVVEGQNERYLSEKGITYIANQITRIATHSTIRYHIKQLRRSHPEVDIILIEPRSDDYQMFFNNPMRYSARLTIAQHGFESVTYGMAKEYDNYKEVLARHGVRITRRRVIDKLRSIEASGYDTEVIRKVLEARPLDCEERERGSVICQLEQALNDLDAVIDKM
jgi:NTE family protein